MRPILLKDIFLFSILFAITAIGVSYAYLELPKDATKYLSTVMVLLFSLIMILNYWPYIAERTVAKIGLFVFVLFLIGIYFVFLQQAISIVVIDSKSLVWFGMYGSAAISLAIATIWGIRFVPRNLDIYLYVSVLILFSVCIVLLPFSKIVMQNSKGLGAMAAGGVFGKSLKMLVRNYAKRFNSDDLQIIIVIFGLLLGLSLGIRDGYEFKYTGANAGVVLGMVFGSLFLISGERGLGSVVGGVLGGILGACMEMTMEALGVFPALLLATSLCIVEMIAINWKELSQHTLGSKIYIFSVLVFLSCLFPIYYLSEQEELINNHLLFLVVVAVYAVTSQLCLLPILKVKYSAKQSVESKELVSIGKIVYDLAIATLSCIFIYLMSDSLLRATNVKYSIVFFASPVFTFLVLYMSDKIFLYFSQASQIEKQENLLNGTVFCQTHYLRATFKRNAIFYKMYQCPIIGCSNEHLVTSKQLIGHWYIL
ncbi:MAG: hypothetical protein AAF518_07895 [Spirochaetota bacterium]